MPPSKSSKIRRAEVRKNIRQQGPTMRKLASSRQLRWGVFYTVVFILIASAIVLKARHESGYQLNQVVDRTIVTRVDLEWINEVQTESNREAARDNTPSIYVQNKNFFDGSQHQLLALPTIAANPDNVAEVAETVRETFPFNEGVLNELKSFHEEGQPTAEWIRRVNDLLDDLKSVPIINQITFQEETARRAPTISLMIEPDVSLEMAKRPMMVNQSDHERVAQAIDKYTTGFPPEIRESLIAFFQNYKEPAYRLDEAKTTLAKNNAASRVKPVTHKYQANKSVLISAGTRLTNQDIELLRREQEIYIKTLRWTKPTEGETAGIDGSGMSGEPDNTESVLERLQWTKCLLLEAGPILLVILITISMCITMKLLHPRVADNPMRGFAMVCLLLGTLLLAWALRSRGPTMTAAAAVGPTMLASVILAIAYSRRLAATISVLQGMLIALALNLSIGLFIATLTGAVVAVIQLQELRQRGELIKMGFMTGLVVCVCVMAAGISEHYLVSGILGEITWNAISAFIAALVVGFFVLGALPFIEKTFKVTTGMTLLELGDMNHPLLKRLAQIAPNTFNHSLQVGTLAEASAKAIGANALLCRVGSYYHDIGKMNKPQYFIENQIGSASRHANLSPAMSLLIIVGHVKDGAEMAREYGLPPVIRHFIESHHGTTLVEYFFHEAKKQTGDAPDATAPKEIEYKYPGPKPQSREAAILLLCDSVEAAARTLPEPSTARIEQLVHGLMTKRLLDGQFDQCNLTLNDLHRVSEAVTKTLSGIYHGRIAYPKSDEGEEKNENGNGNRNKNRNGNGKNSENREAV